jgi:pathogenesis-related protein 1
MRWMTIALACAASCGPKQVTHPAHGSSSTAEDGDATVDEATPVEPGDDSGGGGGDDAVEGDDTPPPSDTSKLSPDDQAMLEAHNTARAKHCAPPLTWSSELEAAAQKWADHLRDEGCGFEHSSTDYGENLAAGTTGAMPPEGVVQMWYDEKSKFDFKHGGFGMDTGHFTQLVWVGTTQVGCGMSQCNGFDVWVCNYAPPGNVDGEYRTNVLPTSCAK